MLQVTANAIHLGNSLRAAGTAQERKPPHNAGANLIIFCFRVAVTPEFRSLAKQTTSEPWTVPLPLVRDDLHFQATTLRSATSRL